ncbi:MAG: non-ribosomal peptide synthetase, partial [Candidatus Binatia bacterium]
MRALDIAISADGDKLRINAPKGALTGELRAAIAAGKAELLAMLRAGAAVAARSIAPRGIGEGAPLSLAQERLWFLAQLAPESSVYNLCRGFRLRGPLHRPALAASLDEIVRRHEVLGSKFCTIDGRPMQVPVAGAGRLLQVTDLRRLSGIRRENDLRRRILLEAETPFDLAVGRLLRARLLRVDDAEHVLLLTTHHLVADAWSMGILVGELWQLYRAFVAGQASPLAELPIQYGDFATWQRRRMETAPLQEQLRYWRKQLDGVAVLDLPTDRSRPVRQSFRGRRYPLNFSPSLTASLNRLAAQENATPFMVLLASFQLLLHRYSGQDDIVVGSAVSDRPCAECEGLIGFFVNTLVLRGDLSGQPSFRDYLRRLREVCLDAYAHQDIPFEKLVEEFKPRREFHRQPLFQAFFVLQNTPNRWVVPDGIDVEPLEVANATAQYDLSLYLRERGGRLLGYFEYASDLFDATTIERLAGHFAILLTDIAANPDQTIASLAMLSENERRRMLVEWNDSAAAYPSQSCIHELFEAQVARTPDGVAIEFQSSTLTFAELNWRANRVAHFLRGRGVGADGRVGLLVARSLEMIVGLLGILKAGAAYVPLDPSYPAARLDFMVVDAEIELLLTQRKLAGTISPADISLVCLDDADLFAGQSHENPTGLSSAASAAYVIYTSGSTGFPKGVVGLHRGAVNRCAWMWRRYPFRRGEVCCSKTSLSFVDSVWEIFGPLLQGFPLAIADDDTAHDPHALIEFLAHRRVSRIVLVPSLLKAFLDDGADLAVKLPRLKLWTSSGEALTVELAQRFRKNLPEALLLNLYGSSEVAADASYFEYDGGASGKTVAIGRPISNSMVYLLDAQRRPVPVGVIGELYVGGDGLAWGYWRRPELTAEKFVVNPFSADPGSRLFRSGDLARYRADGNLEFLGRADNQIKIAGQRVEPSEIEAALRCHPRIDDCIVN